MKRSLSLKRETLSALADDELGFVGGQQIATQVTCGTCGTLDYSIRSCFTLPVYECFSLYPGCSALCTA